MLTASEVRALRSATVLSEKVTVCRWAEAVESSCGRLASQRPAATTATAAASPPAQTRSGCDGRSGRAAPDSRADGCRAGRVARTFMWSCWNSSSRSSLPSAESSHVCRASASARDNGPPSRRAAQSAACSSRGWTENGGLRDIRWSRRRTQEEWETSFAGIPHLLTEQPEGAGEVLLDPAAGDAEFFGDLLVGKFLEVPENKNLAAAGRQGEDRLLQRRGFLARHDEVGGVRRRGNPGLDGRGLAGLHAVNAADPVAERQMARGSEKERAGLGNRAQVHRPVSLHVGVVCDVLRLVSAPENRGEVAAKR